MKKIFIILLTLTALCSCGKKENSNSNKNNADFSTVEQESVENLSAETSLSVTEVSETYTTTVSETIENTSATSVTTVQTSQTVTTSTIADTTVINSDELQPDPLGDGSFSYDSNGAVQFESEPDMSNDRLLISGAQALFDSACHTQWDFTVGCPYEIDVNSTVQNGFGWNYYKITDENIKSLSDVENDYYKVFSERYPNEDLSMLYLEYEGNVYALNGQREMNIYYSVSRVKSIQSRTDDEIFFTVENLFEGTDKNPNEDYSEEDTFSVVISPDGTWKVGKFTLPY